MEERWVEIETQYWVLALGLELELEQRPAGHTVASYRITSYHEYEYGNENENKNEDRDGDIEWRPIEIPKLHIALLSIDLLKLIHDSAQNLSTIPTPVKGQDVHIK